MQLDKFRTVVFGVGLLAALGVLVFRPFASADGSHLSTIVATIFSVLAGLLAIALNLIVMSRDPEFRSEHSRRRYRSLLSRRLRRHNWLFYVYVTILVSLFYSEILKSEFPVAASIFQLGYLSLAAAALIWSFTIPGTIAQIHQENEQLSRREETAADNGRSR